MAVSLYVLFFFFSNLPFTETKHSMPQLSCSPLLVCMSEIAILPSHCALYYLPGQICPTTSDTNILGFHCAFSIAVSRWTTSLSPAERSEWIMDLGEHEGWGAVFCIQQAIFKLPPPEGKTFHSILFFPLFICEGQIDHVCVFQQCPASHLYCYMHLGAVQETVSLHGRRLGAAAQ